MSAEAAVNRFLFHVPDRQIEEWLSRSDYASIFFEHYKHAAVLAVTIGNMDPRSEAVIERKALHYAVIIGLLSRCGHLIHGGIKVSHDNKCDDVLTVINRLLFETALRIIWLTQAHDSEGFEKFVASGLKFDLKFKSQLFRSIEKNGSKDPVRESRMMESVNLCIAKSGLSEDQIQDKSMELPSVYDMIQDIGGDFMDYEALYRLPSHAVHGSWTELITYYVELADSNTLPTMRADLPKPTQDSSARAALYVYDACECALHWMLEEDVATPLAQIIYESRRRLHKHFKTAYGIN